jgi:hypothetical protein
VNKVPDIAAALAALTPEQTVELLAALPALGGSVDKAAALRAKVEAKRDATVAKFRCGCGNPGKYVVFASWRQARIEAYLDVRYGGAGGVTVNGRGHESADCGPEAPGQEWVEEDCWVNCGDNDCALWAHVLDGQNLIDW